MGTKDLRQIPVTLAWDDERGEWGATASSPFVASHGTTIENAVTYIRRALFEKLEGKEFQIVEKIEPPAKLRELVAETERAVAELRRLTEEVPRLRARVLSTATGRYRMNQAHAAEMLGVSSSYLTKIAGKVALQATQETTQALKHKARSRKTSAQ